MALSESFYFYLVSTISSFLIVGLGFCYKSKCKIIKCCGIIEVDRDVDVEQKEDELEFKGHNNA
jgi:hypothetical protein